MGSGKGMGTIKSFPHIFNADAPVATPRLPYREAISVAGGGEGQLMYMLPSGLNYLANLLAPPIIDSVVTQILRQ